MPASPSRKTVFEEKLSAVGFDTELAKLRTFIAEHVDRTTDTKARASLWLALTKDKNMAGLVMGIVLRHCQGQTTQSAPIAPRPRAVDAAARQERAESTRAAAIKLVGAREEIIRNSIKDRLCWSDGTMVAKTTIASLMVRVRDSEFDTSLAYQLWEKCKKFSDKKMLLGTCLSEADFQAVNDKAKLAARELFDKVSRETS